MSIESSSLVYEEAFCVFPYISVARYAQNEALLFWQKEENIKVMFNSLSAYIGMLPVAGSLTFSKVAQSCVP